MAAPVPTRGPEFLGYYNITGIPNGNDTFTARNCALDAVLANITGPDTLLYGNCVPTTAAPEAAIMTACAAGVLTNVAGSQITCGPADACATTTIWKDGNNFTSAAITAFNCEPTPVVANVEAWMTIWPDRQFINLTNQLETQAGYGLPAWSNYHPEVGTRTVWLAGAIIIPIVIASFFALGMVLLQTRRRAAAKFHGYDGGVGKEVPGWHAGKH